MNRRLIIDGNAVYEIDEECMLGRRMEEEEKTKEPEKNVYMEEYKKTLRRNESGTGYF